MIAMRTHTAAAYRVAIHLIAAVILPALAALAPQAAADALHYHRPSVAVKPVALECEVAVYGGTSAGTIAAIQAARMGRKTILISFNQHVGGLTSGGLTATDLGKPDSIGGLALEFYARLGGKTDFKASSAEKLYRGMLTEAGVTVLPGRKLESVNMDGTFEPVNFSELPPPRRGLPVPLRKLYEMREEIFQDHVTYQQGLLYFLANDPQLPKELQERSRKFGLDPGEFRETGHWPHQLYIREGRRMVSDYVVTQADCEAKRLAEDSVGLASYPMDSHFCQRVPVEENGVMTVRNEGGFGHDCAGPYPVSYRAIVPKKEECENLLVPVSLSASHVAFGSIRMEPVFMILDQSAGTAASFAIDNQIPVQDVDYEKLKQRLVADGQRLNFPTP